MTRSIALLLTSLAGRVLPPGREEWGVAMRAEVQHIRSDGDAIIFSVGCMSAAVKDRARDVPSLAVAGLWMVTLITVGCAVFHFGCAVRGTAILLGTPDPHFDKLLSGSAAERSAAYAYRAATPVLVFCLFALALAHASAAFFLVQRKLIPFVASAWVALASASTLCSVILWIGSGGTATLILFAALVLQVASVPLIWRFLPSKPGKAFS